MGEQTKSVLIGIFVIAACTLVVSLILFLKPKVGDGKQVVYVRFSDINRINVGTRVLFAGKPVGEVVAIYPITDARQKPSVDLLGRIYYYQLVLKVDSHIKIYDTDKISIQTSGLLGERSIAIIPQKPPKGVIPKLISDQPIYAESTDPIENAFVELSDLANDMQVTVREINQWIQKNGDDLGNAVRSFGGAMDEVQTMVHTVNEECVIDEVKKGIINFSNAMDGINTAVCTLNNNHTFDNAGDIMVNIKSASASVDEITNTIASGKGTIGRLVNSDDLYLSMNAIMSKANTLMNDINHYGILFHLNKSWQRQRLQRITALNALDTPGGFKNYFENEVDDINTAMSRLSMLISKAETEPEKDKILGDPKFLSDFAELLRQSEELSNNLRLYNEQLSEARMGK